MISWTLHSFYRRRKLFEIRKRLGIPSVRKNTTTSADRAQALLDIKTHDRVGKWGVSQVRQRLANEGILVSRLVLIAINRENIDWFSSTQWRGTAASTWPFRWRIWPTIRGIEGGYWSCTSWLSRPLASTTLGWSRETRRAGPRIWVVLPCQFMQARISIASFVPVKCALFQTPTCWGDHRPLFLRLCRRFLDVSLILKAIGHWK